MTWPIRRRMDFQIRPGFGDGIGNPSYSKPHASAVWLSSVQSTLAETAVASASSASTASLASGASFVARAPAEVKVNVPLTVELAEPCRSR